MTSAILGNKLPSPTTSTCCTRDDLLDAETVGRRAPRNEDALRDGGTLAAKRVDEAAGEHQRKAAHADGHR